MTLFLQEMMKKVWLIFKNKLASEFQIEDLGALKYFLKIEFARSKKEIFLIRGNMLSTCFKLLAYLAVEQQKPLLNQI